LYTTAFNEILKINTLIEHFYETQKNDSTLTFYHFLVMHYVTDDLNDKDNDRDQQLPFKSADTHTSGNSIFYISNQNIQPMAARLFRVCEPVKIIAKDLFIDTDFDSIVWHPPKNA
jgi:hypothetical protein